MARRKQKPERTSRVIGEMRHEVDAKAVCSDKEGLFRAVLKASFVRTFDYVEHLHVNVKDEDTAEGFFSCASLRQCCEDLIALKFIGQLSRADRDTVIQSLMVIATSSGIEKQLLFFRKSHPFQPVLSGEFPPGRLDQAKGALTNVGQRTGFWNTQRKLPPIEQMARKVKLTALYDFLYAATSEIVHFNVRIALRSGWGGKESWRFSPSHMSRYYVMFGRCYGVYLFVKFSRAFARSLALSAKFMQSVNKLEVWLESQLRWPEIVTFEEMNQPHPGNIILYATLQLLHRDRVQKLELRHRRRLKPPGTGVLP
ncbi:MAG: DUF5677 domain-containing protein [Candidatus Acidiferrales bacterium]